MKNPEICLERLIKNWKLFKVNQGIWNKEERIRHAKDFREYFLYHQENGYYHETEGDLDIYIKEVDNIISKEGI